jgi:hypothetical protein
VREREESETPSLDLVFDEVNRQLDLQWQVWEAVDGRLRLLLGFIGAVFVAALAFSGPDRDMSDLTKVVLVVAFVTLLTSGTVATLAWLPGKFDRPPKPSTLRDDYLTSTPDITRLTVLDTMLDAYSENQRRIDEKLAGFRNAGLALGISILFIATGAIIELVR